jgi:hypothetical protein
MLGCCLKRTDSRISFVLVTIRIQSVFRFDQFNVETDAFNSNVTCGLL